MSGDPAEQGTPAVGDEIEFVVERIAAGGDGFARLPSGMAVFADAGLPGDRVRGIVTHARQRFARARVEALVAPGSTRVESECAYSEACGGCRFRSASYEDELRWKVEATVESVRRLSGTPAWPDPEVIAAPSTDHYRERARLHLGKGGATGFFAPGSNDLIATENCRVLHPSIDGARRAAASLFDGVRGVEALWMEWDDVRGSVAITAEVPRKAESPIARKLQARIDRTGIPDGIGAVTLSSGGRTRAVSGDGRVARSRPIGDRDVVVLEPAGGFSQVGGAANARLQDEVIRACAPSATSNERPAALELFAGAGNLTFPLLGAGFDVDAVEGTTPAVHAAAAAYKSLAPRPPARARFYAHDLGTGLPEPVTKRLGDYAVILLDPPRGGVHATLLEALAATRATRLVYVSCDPAAMARDATRLATTAWRPTRWTLLDLFPRTPHIEALAVFDREG